MLSSEYSEIFKNTYFEKHLQTTNPVNSRAAVFQESLALSLLAFRGNTRILLQLASFRTFDSCTILKNAVCDGFLARLGHFHHCNLADFVYRTQVQTGIRVCYVQYSPKKLFKLRRENACDVSSKKSWELFFPYFVFSWHILVQSLVKRFPKQIYFFLFLF